MLIIRDWVQEGETSTWQYQVDELECAQDLSNWVLELPDCVVVQDASPAYELVNPDPNSNLYGIKWQTGAGFVTGVFEIVLDNHWAVDTVAVAAKGPDVAYGEISGPACMLTAMDEDNDGYPIEVDCDDLDPLVYPGVFEICGDNIDQDCDGEDLSCSEDDGEDDDADDADDDADDGDDDADDGDDGDDDADDGDDDADDDADDGDDDADDGDNDADDADDGDDDADDDGDEDGACENLNIPAGALPPPGECKAWVPGLEAGQQGPPIPCDCTYRAPGSCLINSSGAVVACD